MQFAWLSLALITTAGYHLVMKVTPVAVNPFLSLAATYALGAAVFLACFALAGIALCVVGLWLINRK